MKTLMDLKKLDVEKTAAAIEADAGQSLPGLRESIQQAQNIHLGWCGRTQRE